MSLFVLTASDELYDCLLQAVPLEFAGKQFLFNALWIFTVLLLNRPSYAYYAGFSREVSSEFELIRLARLEKRNVQSSQLNFLTRFYKDVISSYLIYFGELNEYNDLLDLEGSLPGCGRLWAADSGFMRFHETLKSVAVICAPEEWHVPLPEVAHCFDYRGYPGYCYLKIIAEPYVKLFSSLLGPMPTFEALMTIIVPKAMISRDGIDALSVSRTPFGDTWRIAPDEEARGCDSFPVERLLTRQYELMNGLYDERSKSTRLLDRIGVNLADKLQHCVFERAMQILAKSPQRESSHDLPSKVCDDSTPVETLLPVSNVPVVRMEELPKEEKVPQLVYVDGCEIHLNREFPMDRLLSFALEHYDLLGILIRDDTDRIHHLPYRDRRFYYDRERWDHQGEKMIRFDELIDLWLVALNELAKDFETVRFKMLGKLSASEGLYRDYFNK